MSDDLEQRVAELERQVADLTRRLDNHSHIPLVSKEGLEDSADKPAPKIKRVRTEGLEDLD